MSAIILYQSLTLFAEAGSLNQTQSGGGHQYGQPVLLGSLL